jgi:hypothetical protein
MIERKKSMGIKLARQQTLRVKHFVERHQGSWKVL